MNDAFLTSVSPGRELRGENVSKLIYPKNMQQLLEAGGSDLSLEDRQFTVFAAKTEHGFVLYFIDDTYYKEINREFEETRPIVALAYFDNREELARDSSGMEDARVASEVESALNEWANSMGGFCKRLSGGRYLILTDEGHIRVAMEKRFEVLDAVRRIKGSGNRSATISMGVARGASTLQEAESWARAALDMALGRGGDQVAVKQKAGRIRSSAASPKAWKSATRCARASSPPRWRTMRKGATACSSWATSSPILTPSVRPSVCGAP